MRKFLSILLVLTMVLSLVACGNKAKDDPTNPPEMDPTGETSTYDENQVPDDVYTDPTDPTEPTDKYVVDESGNVTDIRNDGHLPSKEAEMTDQELDYYIADFVNAIINLDVEKIEKYASNADDAAVFRDIASSEQHKTMYQKTIGNIMYLEDSHYLVYKDPFYTYSRWYTDTVCAGSIPKAHELSLADIDNVYNKYYPDALYIIERVYNHSIGISLNSGHIKFDLDGTLELMGYAKATDLSPSNSISLTNMVFGTARNDIVSDYEDNVNIEGLFGIILSRDLDAMIDYVDNHPNYDLNFSNKEATYDDCYQLYYKNELLRNKIAEWMEDNVEIYGSDFGVVTYAKSNIMHKDNWPFNLLTEAERSEIAHLPMYTDFITYEVGGMVEWGQYYMIVEQMIYDGAIDCLYVN